ncbi:MAG: FKBP-type peptidyl-prolyl cis-trans isomerase, partial [Rikenellaceae bacterium]|nr:FKBP-type peptidyl-prolyl cis-trans isomerase [Rikenellaceae bacterium]
VIILMALGALLHLSASAQSGFKTPPLKNDIDSVSFFVGMDIGQSIMRMADNLDIDLLAQGMKEYFSRPDEDYHAACTEYLREYFNVRMPAQRLAEAEAFLDNIAAQPNICRTESGLLYEIIEQGDMNYRVVEDDDSVEVTYVGTLANGKEFDRNDEGTVFGVNRVIRGFGEGVRLVGKGGRIKLYIHPELGYGAQGQYVGDIPGNAVLIFDVTVLDAPQVY